ncbi:hypothetical protein LCGC14_0693480 [marine sediment metagenome]|uniref:Uncharacterized protein n=1 Tax=marine sediment metagenome TaxID=412755 RepID=A0A0F9QJX2_9ZZZZ|nr:MAG: hypothetical protein Lokiarch_02990 [Candidatus Lokiarchaeum sp. GC14_75]
MEERKNQILDFIKEIENRNIELENYLSDLSISSRNATLKDIMKDILENNEVLRQIEKSKGIHLHTAEREKSSTLENMVESYTAKIIENPTKKIIYLREFLNNFRTINDSDKDVILNSLKDENDEKLSQKMTSLVKIFL